ncbi:SapC family protein [Desulfopila aestuarii]|uniref:SapC protein n=1 Tax=Desulfopila aestuarii DSM 18488 TaxID=1121416 RepID=A0A1M7YHY5_9BACT|nr:SapC family protein [Desulfopila aestuarii]SHO52255.1 SapC protein [Desulfopila aestuarii DSM 18488]
MFTKIEPLSQETHLDLRYNAIQDFDFARKVLHAPLSASEFLQASRHYAIVFPKDDSTPMAMFTLIQQINQYIQEDGSWSVPYIPAHIRRYPFVLAKVASEEGKENEETRYALCIDRDAPHFAAEQGDIMFTANGEMTSIGQNALKFLETFQQELHVTQLLCRELAEKDVLIPQSINVEQDGQTVSVELFRIVDMGKVNALDDATLAKWVRNGLLGLILLHVQSLANLQAFTR